MSWYSVELSGSSVQDGVYHRLCRAFQQAFIAADAPVDMALLAERHTRDDVRRVLISPASVNFVEALLDEFDAAPCARPNRKNVTLIYGAPGVVARLLPVTLPLKAVERRGDEILDKPTIMREGERRAAASGL